MTSLPHYAEVLEGLRGELRRGSLVIAVLCGLDIERNGGDLKLCLAAAGISISEGALYPMLRRLESQGLLASDWRLEDSRRKRFYTITPAGREMRETLLSDWHDFDQAYASLRP